jgi:hypothetical protein
MHMTPVTQVSPMHMTPVSQVSPMHMTPVTHISPMHMKVTQLSSKTEYILRKPHLKSKISFRILRNNLLEMLHTFVLAHKIVGNTFSSHLHVMRTITQVSPCMGLPLHMFSPRMGLLLHKQFLCYISFIELHVFISSPFQHGFIWLWGIRECLMAIN